MSNNKKIAVIGAGPGGYAAAFHAADLGLDVTLIDKEANPGGVCLYRGCIPSKSLLHIARVIREAEEAKEFGVTFAKPKIDIKTLRDWKNNIINKLTSGLGILTKQRKINYIQGTAKYLNSKEIEIKSQNGKSQTLKVDKSIIASGSVPAKIPGIPYSSKNVMDSTGALQLDSIPKKLLVIGGGYIGLELATAYSAIGCKVTVVELLPNLMAGADPDLVKFLSKNLENYCENIYLETKVAEIKETKNGLQVKFAGKHKDGETETFDKVLVSVGRKPITEGLGLENTKVKISERGFIEVNDQQQTTDDNIFSIGDVSSQIMLAHKATAEGRIAAEVIAGHKVAFQARAIPAVVFTDPEIAYAGLTETVAKAQGIKIQVERFPWQASGRALSVGIKSGLTKIIAAPDSKRILGVGIVGNGAGELISSAVLMIEMGVVAEDVALSIHPHPTISETLMETAEMFEEGSSTHIYKPRKK